MLATARVRALVHGETAVSYDDIEHVALPSLRHRVLLNFEGEAEGVEPDDVLREIIETTQRA